MEQKSRHHFFPFYIRDGRKQNLIRAPKYSTSVNKTNKTADESRTTCNLFACTKRPEDPEESARQYAEEAYLLVYTLFFFFLL